MHVKLNDNIAMPNIISEVIDFFVHVGLTVSLHTSMRATPESVELVIVKCMVS